MTRRRRDVIARVRLKCPRVLASRGTSVALADAMQSTRHVIVRSVFAHVAQTCDLPPLPAVAARALTLARDPNTKADELSRLVMTDAALAARVLKIAQSVVY